ncbi:MAG: tetratricopeptide repeat protein, partial [Acidobacteriota bacterium]|nr:tetratricopeptide repeat protein [Acidobacteriota bacterium]
LRASIGLYFADRPPKEQAYALRLGSMDIDVAAGDPAYVIEDSYVLPVDVRVLSVYPHAHYLARDMQGYATFPNGRREWLIRIMEWDFLKQDRYTYKEPLFLPAGTRLTMRFTYDNSAENPRNPNRPPRRVVYGPNSSDEMGDLWVQVLPVAPEEFTVLETDFMRKERGKEIVVARRTLANDVDNAQNHYNLGVLLQADGAPEEAESHYRAALQRDPDIADAHHNLAVLLVSQGKNREGVNHYGEVLRIEPDSADVYLNLARIYLSQDALADAFTLLLRGIEIEPSMWELHADIAAAYARQGSLDAAISSYRAALAIDPDVEFLHIGIGEVFGAQGRFVDAEEEFRIALTIAPQDAWAHNDLGMALEQQGRIKEAIESYRRALAIDSAFTGAQTNLDRALRIRSPH